MRPAEVSDTRLFDLNIERILEAWDNSHAVRELIANALDEQTLSGTREVEITKEGAAWLIRDWGRGLRYEHFTQNENPEKLHAVGRVIGKFGVGLKDAMATLHRNGVSVEIESAHGIITLSHQGKHGFDDVVTLHAAVAAPKDLAFEGTRICLMDLPDGDMAAAQDLFLKFSGEEVAEQTKVGKILKKRGQSGRIYVAGLLVAEEENFAFSYDITSLTGAMKRALNRERTNVGRTAYTERVKAMLLQTNSSHVAEVLADQLVLLERGTASDEVRWKDVAIHACKILNGAGEYLFVSASQFMSNASSIDRASDQGITVITVPDNILTDISGGVDVTGVPIRDLSAYQEEWNQSFEFDWVKPAELSSVERATFGQLEKIAHLVGGLPAHVKAVRVSNTMRPDHLTGSDALGLWDPQTSSIVIRRDQLATTEAFAATLLHEIAHAAGGHDDVTRAFEADLTRFLGLTAAAVVEAPSTPKGLRGFLGI